MFNYFLNDYLVNIKEGNVNYLVTDFMLYVYIVFTFNSMPWNWKGILKRLLEIIILFVVRITLSSIIYAIPALFNFLVSYNTMYVVYPLVLVFYLLVFCRRKPMLRLVQGFAFYALFILSFSFGYDLDTALDGYVSFNLSYFMLVVQISLMVAACIILYKFQIKQEWYLSVNSTVLLTLLGAIGIILCFLSRLLVSNVGSSVQLFLTFFHLLFMIIEVVGYLLFYRSTIEHNKLMYSEMEKRMINEEKSVMALSASSIEKLRELRHDAKNQYAVLNELLQSGEYDKCREYFADYATHITAATAVYDTGNTVIDSLINAEYAKANDSGVTLDIAAAVPPQIHVNDVDICTILFNVIDNAIEAASQFLDEGKRRVDFKIIQKEDMLFISCTNPIAAEKLKVDNGVLKTSKKEGDHGYGLKIIKGVVKKWDGEIKIETKDGYFSVNIIL